MSFLSEHRISPLLKSPPTQSPLQFHRIAIHRLQNSPPSHYTADKLHRIVNLRQDEFSASQHTDAGDLQAGRKDVHGFLRAVPIAM